MKKKWVIPALLFLSVFILYILTLPDINTGFADSDELITVAKIFGVAHPPSYPLYTVLAMIFGVLPLPLTFAGKVNLSNTFYHSLTVVFIYLSLKLVIGQFYAKKGLFQEFFSILGSLVLAFCISFWFYGVVTEVFSLSNLFAAILIYLSLLYAKEKNSLYLYLLAIVGGFGLANQQAIILLYPGFGLYLLLQNWRIVIDWQLIGKLIGVLVIAFLLPYTYLPIAARNQTSMNWENPQDLAGIYRVITRRTYAEASPLKTAYLDPRFSVEYFPKGLSYYSQFVKNELGFILISFSLIGGVFLLYKRKFSLLGFLLSGILGGGMFFSVYSAIPINPDHVYFRPHIGIYHRFFLLSLLFYPFFIVLGSVGLIFWFKNLLLAKRFATNLNILIGLVLVLAVVSNGWLTFSEIRQINFYLANKFARSVLNSLEPDAILFCFTDHSCFSGIYAQEIEGIRKDVLIMHAGFEQTPLDQIRRNYPDLIKTTAEKRTTNHSLIILKDIIRWNIDKRPIYVAGINNDTQFLSSHNMYGDPFYLLPVGCVMKVSKVFEQIKQSPSCQEISYEMSKSKFIPRLPITYQYSAYMTYQHYFNALQYSDNGCSPLAEKDLQMAIKLSPDFKLALASYSRFENIKDNARCKLPKEGPTVAYLKKEVEKAKKKKDLINRLYYLSQITLIDPNDIKSRMELGKLYKQIGGVENAKIEFRDILKMDSGNKEAKQHLKDLL